MQAFELMLRWTSWLLAGLSAIGLLLMMAHVCADVFAYSVIGRPLPGTAEVVAYYYMVAVVFLPLPLAELRNANIHVDMFYNLSPDTTRRIMLIIAYSIQIIFFSALSWRTGSDAWLAYLRGEVVFGQIYVPTWPSRFFLPAGFGLAAVVSILQLIKALTRWDWDPSQEESGRNEASQIQSGVL